MLFDIGPLDKVDQDIKLLNTPYKVCSPFIMVWFDPPDYVQSYKIACGHVIAILMRLNAVLDAIMAIQRKEVNDENLKANLYFFMVDRFSGQGSIAKTQILESLIESQVSDIFYRSIIMKSLLVTGQKDANISVYAEDLPIHHVEVKRGEKKPENKLVHQEKMRKRVESRARSANFDNTDQGVVLTVI